MDVDFLVNRVDGRLSRYLSYHSVTPPGGSSRTLDLAVPGWCPPDFFCKGGECRGLLFFDNLLGRVLICNPTTKEMKFLPPSHVSKFPMAGDRYFANGFGYDEYNQDFKILRLFRRDSAADTGEYIGRVPPTAEIYSFKTNSWRQIPCLPDVGLISILSDRGRIAAHLNGILYWATKFPDTNYLLSFNLATEAFSLLPFPYPNAAGAADYPSYSHDIFNLDGEVGAFVYEHPGAPEWEYVKQDNTIQVWVWKHEEGLWEKLFHILFDDVARPLGLKDNLLFLEVKTGGGFSQLGVYDVTTKKLENLNVHAHQDKMQIFPYTRSTHRLPEYAEDATEWRSRTQINGKIMEEGNVVHVEAVINGI